MDMGDYLLLSIPLGFIGLNDDASFNWRLRSQLILYDNRTRIADLSR